MSYNYRHMHAYFHLFCTLRQAVLLWLYCFTISLWQHFVGCSVKEFFCFLCSILYFIKEFLKENDFFFYLDGVRNNLVYVTGPGKTGLIYTKYMCLYYGTYLQFCVCYPKSVSYIEFLMALCIYHDILDTMWSTDKKL